MKAVKGRYNGSVVILEEPAPVDNEVSVIVYFPEPKDHAGTRGADRFNWLKTRDLENASEVSAADEVIRQRRLD